MYEAFAAAWAFSAAAWEARRSPRVAPQATPKWSLGPKPAHKPGHACERFPPGKDTTPGPGAYDCADAVSSPRRQRPSWGFGKSRRNWTGLQRTYWPQIPSKASTSPGQYSPKDAKRPAQTIGRDPRDKEAKITPGPGDWSPTDKAARKQPPQFSMRPRPAFFWGSSAKAPHGGHVRLTEKSIMPGPGAYDGDPVSAHSPMADFTDLAGEFPRESPRTTVPAAKVAPPGPGTYAKKQVFGGDAPKVSMYHRRSLSAGRHTPTYTYRPHHDARGSPGPGAYDSDLTQFAAGG
eukprot:TRINITY_DN20695_c0_g1_i2.p1 TRINITY_DN20695_c0_g1~~TRINITY_DN20695_c0_g1_i2.p1  ORF type:complete len:301 (-),score=21.38 TRINITY_DN20695_c0_g1_i2:38-910(-)